MRVATSSVLIVLVLALVGCSGDGKDAASTTTAVTLPSTTTIAVAPPGKADADDQKAADGAVLTKDDLSGSWKSGPWPTGDQPFFAQAKGDCADLKKMDSTEELTASALSELLLSPQAVNVAMRIHVYPTEAEAKAVFAAFTRRDAADCIASTVSVMKTELGGSGSAAVEIGSSAVTVPGAVAFFGVARAGVINLGVGYAVALKGRAVVLVTTGGPGDQAPNFDALLAPAMDRLSGLS